jgi:hypothetical protein
MKVSKDKAGNRYGRCDQCGARVELCRGDSQCDCGAEYNCGGDRLRKGWSYDENRNEANDYQEA